ncbi:MAG: DUF177 domain-containing protein [Clostridia bacterium]|nr:DUF177 domain-containing protein [Clostridia bacterium]
MSATSRIDVQPVKGPNGGTMSFMWTPPAESFDVAGQAFEILPGNEARVSLRGQDGRIEARVDGVIRVRYPCDRCLEPADERIPVHYRQRFVTPEVFEQMPVPEREGEEDGVTYWPYTGSHIDLGEGFRQNLLLAAPPKHLCREDCRGLCPVCGRNRNVETCDCEPDSVDPRLAALRDLLQEPGDEAR